MAGSVSVDTQKLHNIKSALQQFNSSMQTNATALISYLNEKKSEVEANLKRKIERIEENERSRQQAERNASDDSISSVRTENSRQRQHEASELNELKSLIRMFGTVSDELTYHLRQMTGVYSDTVEKGSSTLGNCIQILDEYFAVTFPGAYNTGNTGSTTGTSSQQSSLPPPKQMRDYASGWVSQLTDEQKEAIHDYTKEVPPYYKNINGGLRGTHGHYDFGNEERCELIHAALKDARTPCDITVYRGCSASVLGNLAHASDESLVGALFADKGFASTSMSRGLAFNNDMLLEIHLPAGSHAANIETLSAAGRYEEEVLIDRGQLFQVVGVHRDNNGRRVLEVNAIRR